MKGKTLAITLIIVFLTINAIRSIWTIDIVISALLSGSALYSIYGIMDISSVYHSAILSLEISIFGLATCAYYYFVKKQEQTQQQ